MARIDRSTEGRRSSIARAPLELHRDRDDLAPKPCFCAARRGPRASQRAARTSPASIGEVVLTHVER